MVKKKQIISILLLVIFLLLMINSQVMAASITKQKVTGLNIRVQNEKAYLNWVEISNADGYEVYVYVPGDGYSNLGTVSKNSATLKGIQKGVTYKAKIRAYEIVSGKTKYSDFSEEVTFSIKGSNNNLSDNTKLSKVTGLNVSVQNEKAYLNWIAVSGADGYEVYVYVPGYGYSNLGTVNRNSATLKGTTKGVTYKVKVEAYKIINGKKQYGEFSDEVSFVIKKSGSSSSDKDNTTNKPEKVTGVYAEVTGKEVLVKWNKVSNVDGYEIYFTVPGYGNTVMTTSSTSKVIDGITITYSNYTVKVRAYRYEKGVKVYGEYSEEVKFKAEETKPSKVTGLSVKVQNGKAYLNWVNDEKADGYEVLVYIPRKGYSNLGSVSKNSATLKGMTKGVTYTVKIRAYQYENGVKVYADNDSDEVDFKVK